MSHYMQLLLQQRLYDYIKKPDSKEEWVRDFWLETLRLYFPTNKTKAFLVASEKTLPSDEKADVAVVDLSTMHEKIVVVLEAKRKRFETRTSQWTYALKQLERYLPASVGNANGQQEPIYAAIAIGTHVRFYEYDPKGESIKDYTQQSEQPFEVKTDEEEIHKILTEWVEAVTKA